MSITTTCVWPRQTDPTSYILTAPVATSCPEDGKKRKASKYLQDKKVEFWDFLVGRGRTSSNLPLTTLECSTHSVIANNGLTEISALDVLDEVKILAIDVSGLKEELDNINTILEADSVNVSDMTDVLDWVLLKREQSQPQPIKDFRPAGVEEKLRPVSEMHRRAAQKWYARKETMQRKRKGEKCRQKILHLEQVSEDQSADEEDGWWCEPVAEDLNGIELQHILVEWKEQIIREKFALKYGCYRPSGLRWSKVYIEDGEPAE